MTVGETWQKISQASGHICNSAHDFDRAEADSLIAVAEWLGFKVADSVTQQPASLVPFVLVPGVPHPKGAFTALPLLRENAFYFLECLPIIAVQYLMALRSNNILIPIGVGFAAWVGALAAVSSKVAIWWPYGYTIVHYLRDKPKGAHFAAYTQLHWLAFGAFVLLTLVSYAAFVMKRERG